MANHWEGAPMNIHLDRRKFLQRLGTFGAGLGACMAMPSLAWRIRGPDIRVVGVGGCGINAMNDMIRSGIAGVSFAAIDADEERLSSSLAPERMLIGTRTPRGCNSCTGLRGERANQYAVSGKYFSLPLRDKWAPGCGACTDPEIGRKAAEDDAPAIAATLNDADLLIVVAGLGAGTGSGATPVISRIAKRMGIITAGVVMMPFTFEGSRRMRQAAAAQRELAATLDTTTVVSFQTKDSKATLGAAFRISDNRLLEAVTGYCLAARPRGMLDRV